ncbi:FecR family protein [Sunxiuqinia elliptica]|nr:FecR family protein [Sunxiuqinia elliptica]
MTQGIFVNLRFTNRYLRKMTDDLLFKYITEQATEDELREVHEWIAQAESNQQQLARIRNSWVLAGLDQEIDLITKERGINRVLQQVRWLNKQKRVKTLRRQWLQYAAVAILLVGLSGFFGYFLSTSTFDGNMGYTEVIAPRGERSQIVLPDGSLVKLNAESKLRFKPAFQSKMRSVELEGEAFFQVSHDELKPFVVKTAQLEVQVLGTSFDISSYPDDEHITTYLETGKVKVNMPNGEELILKPDQAISYNKESGEIQKLNLTSDYLLDWTKGLLTVRNETIEALSRKLERRYNIQILFGDNEVKHHHYTGSINDEDLDIVLEALEFTSSLNYKRKGNVVTLYSK